MRNFELALLFILLAFQSRAQGTSVVFAGDSITAGISWCSVTTDSQTWPAQAMSLPWFTALPSPTRYMNATTGWVTNQLITSYSSAVHPYRPNGTTVLKAYLFVFIGTNDLKTDSAATIQSDLLTYWGMARADGFKVVAFTVYPSVVDFGAGKDSVRQALNVDIRADSADWDYLIDAANDPTFGTMTTSQSVWNSTLSCDGTHLTASGLVTFADMVNGYLPTLGPIGSQLTGGISGAAGFSGKSGVN